MDSKNRLDMNEYSQEISVGNSNLKMPFQDPDIQDTVVEMKFLAQSWLDDFEKNLFNGKTIRKLLNPREYD